MIVMLSRRCRETSGPEETSRDAHQSTHQDAAGIVFVHDAGVSQVTSQRRLRGDPSRKLALSDTLHGNEKRHADVRDGRACTVNRERAGRDGWA